MDLNITMRYIMVQAQREAAGGSVCVEHIYLAILSLYMKTVKDIARTPDQEEQVCDDLELVHSFISDEEIDVWPTLYLIREALSGKLPGENIPEPDTDVSGLLARAGKAGEGRQITVSDVICSHDKVPTPLIRLCYVDYDNQPTSKDDAVARGQQIIRERLGLDPIPAIDVTVADLGGVPSAAETVLQPNVAAPDATPVSGPENRLSAKPEPPQPNAPVPPVKSENIVPPMPKDRKPPEIKPPKNDVVFFDIPSPSAAVNNPNAGRSDAKKDKKQPKAKPPKRNTKIAGLTFRGGTVAAAAQYFTLVIFTPAVLLLILAQVNEELLLSDNPWVYAILGIGVFVWGALILKGITSLIGMRLKAFEIFFNTAINIFLGVAVASVLADIAGYLPLPVFVKVFVVLYAFILVIIAMVKVKDLQKLLGQNGMGLSTAMLKLRGAPSAIFFEYLLRSFLLPGLVFAVIWIWDLRVNELWNTVFVFYAFFWVYETIRVLLQAWSLIYKEEYPVPAYRGFKLNTFLIVQHYALALPAFGLFLMWHYNWFPMRTWVIVLYCIYGFLWLWLTIGILVAMNQKGAKL